MGDLAMRHPRLRSTHIVAAALVIAGALAPMAVMAQAPPPAQTQPEPKLGPYKPVPITLPPGLNDPSFEGFRKQLAEIAKNKDRAALARVVASNFFWVPEDKDIADKQKSAIDNLSKALSLDGTDGFGWEALAAYAAETTAMADPQRKGVFCAPAEPNFDERAADELANVTHTDAADWAFPIRDGIEVRAAARQDAAVFDRLGLYLVRVLPDDSPANALLATFAKVLTAAGTVGYVSIDTVLPIGGEQLCYLKDGGAWKIAGFLGGEPNH